MEIKCLNKCTLCLIKYPDFFPKYVLFECKLILRNLHVNIFNQLNTQYGLIWAKHKKNLITV